MNQTYSTRLFNNGFQTLMLFKCTIRKYANELRNGHIYFGNPRAWIKIEEGGDKGQGDKLEGTCASIGALSDNSAFLYLVSQKGMHSFTDKGYTFFRRDSILDIPSLCLFGLNTDSFTEKRLEDGRTRLTATVTKDYFHDFCSVQSPEEYKKTREMDRPVLVMITNPHEFFYRIVKELCNLEVRREEIIISPVNYVNKYVEKTQMDVFPYELLQKDYAFKSQSEVRIVVNSQSKKFLRFLSNHNNHINIGSLDDIIQISDYYFKDMEVYRFGNTALLYSLPQEKTMELRKMNLDELLELLANIVVYKTVDLILPDEFKTAPYNIKLKSVLDLIRDKYGVVVDIVDDSITYYNLNEEQDKLLRYKWESNNTNYQWGKMIEKRIESENPELMLEICKREFSSPLHNKAAQYYAGIVYLKLGMKQLAIDCFTSSYNMDYYPIESLNNIAIILFKNHQFSEAVKVYELIKQYKGNDIKVLSNIGLCYLENCEYDNAICLFSKCLEINANDAFSLFNLGLSYLYLGDSESARKMMNKAIICDPNNKVYKEIFEKRFNTNI